MNRITLYVNSLGRTTRTVILSLAVIFVSAGIAQAATTISANVSTGGTLDVTGLSTLTAGFVSQASSTAVAAFNITGLSTLTGGFVSQASSTVVGVFNVSGATTLASTTATSFQVDQVGTHMERIVSGYCVTASVAIPNTNTSSSTQTYTNCTPSGGTSIITSGDRVFLQATSSLPYHVVIQSASSTASGGLINVGLTNFSTSTAVVAAVYAFNFWAFQ